jgi:branched-subunit amino acid ABC-type transport system permease component
MLSNPAFLLIQLLNSVSLGMNLFIIASGLTLIFGILRVLNFAHGAFFMIGAYVCYTVVSQMTSPAAFWLGVIAAAAALGLLALMIERLLLRHLYEREHLMQLLFTFALVLLLGDLVKMIWGTNQHSVSYPAGLNGAVNLGITYYPSYLLFLCAVGPVIAVLLWLLIERSRWGRLIKAATQDREMLSALGVNVPMVYTLVFVGGSALAGVGGALAAPRVAVAPGMEATLIVECFIIVIIGGLGSLWGSFVGALILGFLMTFGTVLLPEWELVLPYVLMLAILLWRPWGLFSKSPGTQQPE